MMIRKFQPFHSEPIKRSKSAYHESSIHEQIYHSQKVIVPFMRLSFAFFRFIALNGKYATCILPVQVLPFPLKPLKQRHTQDPSVLVHKALGSHSLLSGLVHSSMSLQQGIKSGTKVNSSLQLEGKYALTFRRIIFYKNRIVFQKQYQGLSIGFENSKKKKNNCRAINM